MTNPTGSSGRRSMPGSSAGRGGRTGSYDQMQATLRSQEAAAEETRQAMQAIQVAMNGMLNSLNSMVNPFGGGGGSYGQGPHGGRPTMGGNGTIRPLGDGYYSTPYSPYGNHQAGGRGLSGVRQNVARGLNSRVGISSGNRFEEVYDANGVPKGHNEYDQNNNLVGEHGPGWAGTPEGRSALGGAARRQVASRALGGLAEGGVVGAARAVPYVGAALLGAEAVHEGLTFVGNQREKNAQYQGIYGGSNISQLGQRASGFGYGVSNLFGGGLTWGDSQKAFQGVSALGYQGSQRDQDLSFITDNYKKMGVSVSDSLKLITTAASDLNESLTGLQSGLKGSRDAALAAGMSGNVGTQIYQNNYSQLSSKFAGPGVAAVNNILSPAQASLGRVGSNISLTNMLTNKNSLYMLAQQTGLDYTGLVGAIQSGDGKTVGRALDRQLGSVAQPFSSPQLTGYINSQVKDIAGGSPTASLKDARQGLNSDTLSQIASNVLSTKGHGGLNVDALVASYAQRGVTNAQGGELTPEQAVMQYIATTQGMENFEKAATHNTVLKANAAAGSISSIQGTRGSSSGAIGLVHPTADGVNPVIDHAKATLKGKNVEVMVNNQKRVVSLNTAIKDYPDQIAKGTAVVEGSGGKTVRQALNGEHQTNVITQGKMVHGKYEVDTDTNTVGKHVKGVGKASDDSSDGDDLKKNSGMSVAAYNKLQAKNSAKQAKEDKKNGKVIIEPSAELKTLLNFSVSGNAALATQAAAVGAVPAPGS